MPVERMREYEMVMILSPEATQDELAATVERVDGMIEDGGGAVADHETWGLKRLAYEINDFNEGNYFLTRFSLDAAGVAELNRALTASEDIIRFLLTRQEFPASTKEEAKEADESPEGGDAGPSSEAGPAPEAAPVPAAEASSAAETTSEEGGGEQQ